MKRFNIVLVMLTMVFITSCGSLRENSHKEAYDKYHSVSEVVKDNDKKPQRLMELSENIESVDIVFNDLELYKHYLMFQSELDNRGLHVDNVVLDVKYLLIEKGIENGPQLQASKLESYNNRSKRYILFSPELLEGESDVKLKVAVYKELTYNLGLGIEKEESRILQDRTTDYDYSVITNKDFRDLFNLILAKINNNYCQLVSVN